MQTIIQYAEIASLILTVVGGVATILGHVWLYIDHGRPDKRLEWLRRAISLAAQAHAQADKLLGVGTGTTVEDGVLKEVQHAAEEYLGSHGIVLHLDLNTVKLVLQDLKKISV